MTKLIARFAKLYNLPPEMCPNLNRRRNEGALQFLIHKRYDDGSLSKLIINICSICYFLVYL